MFGDRALKAMSRLQCSRSKVSNDFANSSLGTHPSVSAPSASLATIQTWPTELCLQQRCRPSMPRRLGRAAIRYCQGRARPGVGELKCLPGISSARQPHRAGRATRRRSSHARTRGRAAIWQHACPQASVVGAGPVLRAGDSPSASVGEYTSRAAGGLRSSHAMRSRWEPPWGYPACPQGHGLHSADRFRE